MQKKNSYLSLKTEILITKFTRPFYSARLNCPPFALIQAHRRLRKLTTDFLAAFRPVIVNNLQNRRLFPE